jgi:hypothetical protein
MSAKQSPVLCRTSFNVTRMSPVMFTETCCIKDDLRRFAGQPETAPHSLSFLFLEASAHYKEVLQSHIALPLIALSQ